jgi:hypothetical protein
MPSLSRRVALLLGTLLAVSLVAVAPAVSAHSGHRHLPTTLALPDGFAPEGITSWWKNGRLYAGSRISGEIVKVNPRTGAVRTLVPGTVGGAALGMHVDWKGRLWVAGGGTGTVKVYRARTGELLQTYTFPTAGFINDLVITKKAVYATDSVNPQLLVIPLGRHGRLTDPSAATTRAITGDLVYEAGFNANGIVAKSGWLIVVQTNTGELFRVNPRTGATREIDIGTRDVTNGDGLVLRGRFLYVVRNQDNKIDVYRLGFKLRAARFKGDIESSGFDTPTTATFLRGKLYAVNARFTTPVAPDVPYWITRVSPHP